MPCYVRFRSIQEMLRDGTIRTDPEEFYYDDTVENSIPEAMAQAFFNGEYHRLNCDPFTEEFTDSDECWLFYKRWVSEWSLDGAHPIQEEPTATFEDLWEPVPVSIKLKKKPTAPPAPPAPTRTIKLIAVPATERSCGLCFYQGFKCFTSECNRRYWRLVEVVDN